MKYTFNLSHYISNVTLNQKYKYSLGLQIQYTIQILISLFFLYYNFVHFFRHCHLLANEKTAVLKLHSQWFAACLSATPPTHSTLTHTHTQGGGGGGRLVCQSPSKIETCSLDTRSLFLFSPMCLNHPLSLRLYSVTNTPSLTLAVSIALTMNRVYTNRITKGPAVCFVTSEPEEPEPDFGQRSSSQNHI